MNEIVFQQQQQQQSFSDLVFENNLNSKMMHNIGIVMNNSTTTSTTTSSSTAAEIMSSLSQPAAMSHHNLSSFLPPSRFGSALGASVAFIFIVFGVFGDSLIILAILSKRELRKNIVNIFIVSLQLNDLFNICFNQFLVGLAYLFMKWYGPYIICEIFVYTSIICTGTLLWHHALIAIHR